MAKKVKALRLFGERYEIDNEATVSQDSFFFPEMKLTYEYNWYTGEEGNFFVSEVLPESFVEKFENEEFRMQVWFYKEKKRGKTRGEELKVINGWKHAPDGSGLVQSLLNGFTPNQHRVLGAAKTGYASMILSGLQDTKNQIISTFTSPTHFNGCIRTELEVTVNDIVERENGKKYLKIKLTPFILSVLANGLYIEHINIVEDNAITKEIYLKKSIIGPQQYVFFDNTYFKQYSGSNQYLVRNVWGSKKKYASKSGHLFYEVINVNGQNQKTLTPIDFQIGIQSGLNTAPVGIRLVASKNGSDLLFGKIEKSFFNMSYHGNKAIAKLTTRTKAQYWGNHF